MRYQRHTLIDWFDQERVRDTRVIVIGAGAVGNEVLKNLTLLGVGKIHVFDYDKIEEHNLTRCVLFRDSDIGRFKADTAAKACRGLDPHVEVLASCGDFWDRLTLSELKQADAVLCCVDNFEARLFLNQLCLLTETDLYNAGIDSRYVTVEMFPFSTQARCACYECTFPESAYDGMRKRYSCGWLRKVVLEENKIPTTTITSSIAGAGMTSMLLQRLNKHPQSLQESCRLCFDTITFSSTFSVIQKNPECYACNGIQPHKCHVVSKKNCSSQSLFAFSQSHRLEIMMSEPILLRTICTTCCMSTEYFQSTRTLNEAVTFCTVCKSQSMVPEVVQRMALDEFQNIFKDKDVPCKYLQCNDGEIQFIVEMEANYERY